MFDLFWYGFNRPDFNETFVHHLCALTLAVCTSLLNNRGTGIIVAYLHAFAEIPVNFARIFSSTHYTTAAVISSLFLVTVWFYTRLLLFGYLVYRIWLRDCLPGLEQYVYIYKAEALFCTVLLALHVHWFRLIVKMILNYKNHGIATDIQMQVKKDK